MENLKKNLIFNYIGQIYIISIATLILPLYLQILGAEKFGLISFFTLMQTWLNLFDMGMSPMLSRQVAFLKEKEENKKEIKKIIRSLETIFLVFSLTLITSSFFFSKWIANNWLSLATLDSTETSHCIEIMSIIISLRWFSILYQSGLRGAEYQVWLNSILIVTTTLKFLGSLILIYFFSKKLLYFFIFQLILTSLELLIFQKKLSTSIISKESLSNIFFWHSIKPILPFSLGIAYTSIIWVLLTQLDKLLFSKLLPLNEFGYYALIATIAAGLLQISAPINQAIMPRMTALVARKNMIAMLKLYKKSTQITAAIIFPLAGFIAFFSRELLFSWTGDETAAEWGSPILFWFSLGNGILVIITLQYYLQLSQGVMKPHIIYTTISTIIQLPIIVWVTYIYGANGVAITWFALRAISFLIWPTIIHSFVSPDFHVKWLLEDILPYFLSTFIFLIYINKINVFSADETRINILLLLLFFTLISISINLLIFKMRKLRD